MRVSLGLLLLVSLASAQEGALVYDFSGGQTLGWAASTSGATSSVVSGHLRIQPILQAAGTYRGDFKLSAAISLHAGNYPIVAIKMHKPPRCNFFFDTQLGSYRNTNNNHLKIEDADGSVYYWNLQAGTLGSTTLSQTAITSVNMLQFKVADIAYTQGELDSGKTSFDVDWIRTFPSRDSLLNFVWAGHLPDSFALARPFVHPGLLHSSSDLQRLKGWVTSQTAYPYASFQLLQANNKASSGYVMQGPFTYLTRDASLTIDGVAGGTLKARVESDVLAAYYNALQWVVTDSVAHAQKAIEILDAYAQTTVGISGTDAALNGLYGFLLVNAAEIIRYTNAGWTEAKAQAFGNMAKAVFYPVLQNFVPCAHGNWDLIAMKCLMAIAIYSEDTAMFNRTVNYFRTGQGNGSIYHYVVSDSGQVQESNRDQPHTMLGLGNMAEIAEMGLKQGLDLYADNNSAIRRAVEYTSRYNLGYEVPYQTSYDFCEYNYTDYTPEAVSANGRGQFRAVFEIAYNRYVMGRKESMPYTAEVLAQIAPEGAPFGADNPGYGSWLFYLNEPEPVALLSPRPIVIWNHGQLHIRGSQVFDLLGRQQR